MTADNAAPGAACPGSADGRPAANGAPAADGGTAADHHADQAAPLDALLVDAALGTFRRFAPDLSAAKLAAALARRPGATSRRPGATSRRPGATSRRLARGAVPEDQAREQAGEPAKIPAIAPRARRRCRKAE